jgi:hypothetical protein
MLVGTVLPQLALWEISFLHSFLCQHLGSVFSSASCCRYWQERVSTTPPASFLVSQFSVSFFNAAFSAQIFGQCSSFLNGLPCVISLPRFGGAGPK